MWIYYYSAVWLLLCCIWCFMIHLNRFTRVSVITNIDTTAARDLLRRQESGGRARALRAAWMVSARVAEPVNTWPLRVVSYNAEPPPPQPEPPRRCFPRTGWRNKGRLQRIRRCGATGGWRGSTAWMADITSRSSPTGRCGARGMTATFTVSLRIQVGPQR